MVTEAQTKLAHWIASQGVWSYAGVVKMIEKNSSTVKHLKALAEDMNNSFAEESIERSYVFARIASENGYDFSQMFLMHNRRAYTEEFKTKVTEAVKALNEKGVNTPEERERVRVEFAPFMQARIEKCVKSSPFYAEWLTKQEEAKIAAAFMAQNETTDYEAFKSTYKSE